MVLATGADSPKAEGGAQARGPLRGESGAQSLEFALTLPLVALALLVICGAGLLGAEVVAAHWVARDAARTAAVGGAEAVDGMADTSAGGRDLDIEVRPAEPRAGEVVTVSIGLRSRALAALGLDVWLPARASMPAEPQ